jgi:ZIP family zinc transporter
MAIVVSIGAFISTLLGGLFALYLQDRLHLILGFSAGAQIGVAFFDLLPESLDLASAALGGQVAAVVIATGFVGYMLLDRTIAPHGDKGRRTEKLWQLGALGAGSLSAHSFLDGFCNWSRLQGLSRGWCYRLCCRARSRLFRWHQHGQHNLP